MICKMELENYSYRLEGERSPVTHKERRDYSYNTAALVIGELQRKILRRIEDYRQQNSECTETCGCAEAWKWSVLLVVGDTEPTIISLMKCQRTEKLLYCYREV